MSNLILIGMPACGKSTVGVILAKTAGKRFVDTDLLIQEKENALLQEIIDGKGNQYFRQVEEQVLRSLEADNAVISTGGSAVYCHAAMERLKENGVAIYLDLPLAEIVKRLDNIHSRGITMEEGVTLTDLYHERIPLYEKYADIIIQSAGLTVEETVEAILSQWSIQGGRQ